MDIKFQINNSIQTEAIIKSDEYIPLKIEIESSIPSSSAILYIFFRDQKNLMEIKIGITFGELYSVTVIFSNQFVFHECYFDESKYLTWKMPSYLIFPYPSQPDASISSLDIEGRCTIKVFLDVIILALPTIGEEAFIFYQSNYFGIITDNKLNILGFIIKNISTEKRKMILEFTNNNK